MHIILSILSLSLIIFLIAQFLPAVHVKNFQTAIIVALVYSILNFFLGWIVTIISLPLIFLTLGLFKLVINAFFLWVTDKIVDDFKIDGFWWTIVTASLIAVSSMLVNSILGF